MKFPCQSHAKYELSTPKHGAFFVQDNPWCECEKQSLVNLSILILFATHQNEQFM